MASCCCSLSLWVRMEDRRQHGTVAASFAVRSFGFAVGVAGGVLEL